VKLTETADRAAIDELHDEWDRLVARDSGATVYQTWEWNRAWWQAFGKGKALRLLMVHDGPDLVGLAPFYVRKHLGTPLRRLAFVGTGVSDYLHVLAADGAERPVFAEVCQYLIHGRGFDFADLQQLPETSRFADYLKRNAGHGCNGSANGSGRRALLRPMELCPYVPLPTTWEQFLRRLSKRMRANIGYYTRLANRDLPEVAFELCEGEAIPEAMTALFRLHQRRWRSRMLPGVLGSRSVRGFHYEVAERFHERGWLRLHIVRGAGTIVAALYCFNYRNRYYYYLGGFEPELGKYSLGTTLTAEAVRNAIAEGCAEFDFLRGEEAYKERWKPEGRRNVEYLVAVPGSWRAEATLALNRIERYVEHRAKAFSDRGKGART